jgi:2-amino-4-hydroxy-6-hydroxymethyldihydropteridine diphosphokinase
VYVAVVGLGSNLGDRQRHLRGAIDHLARTADVELVAISPIYETDAIGPPQPRFLNAAVRIRTGLEPEHLLDRMLAIERVYGRKRREKWGPRTLDLDLLVLCDPTTWDLVEVDTPRLRVPHPALLQRPFALAPLLDVAPELAARWRPVLDALGGPPPRARRLQAKWFAGVIGSSMVGLAGLERLAADDMSTPPSGGRSR